MLIMSKVAPPTGCFGAIWLQHVAFQPTKDLYVQLYKVSKDMNQLLMDVISLRWTKCEGANKNIFIFMTVYSRGRVNDT